jgi:hypothetical protein
LRLLPSDVATRIEQTLDSCRLLMDPALWIAFVGTVIVMQMPPGPDSMLVVARGIGQGRLVALPVRAWCNSR